MSFGKKDIIINISSEAHMSKDNSNKFISKFVDLIKENSQNSTVKISKFGSFHTRFTPKRIGRNPKTGSPVALSGKYVPHFKPGKELRDRVNSSILQQQIL